MRIAVQFIVLFWGILGFSQNLVQDPALIKKQLDNGLTYYIYPTNKVKNQAYFRLFVKVGSVQETPEQRGLAHFLEHMAFNGTKHFKANELVEFLENKGSKFGHDLNAHTSFEETIYKLKIPTKNHAVVDSTLTIMADWVNGMLLDSLEVEQERGVVLSEWLSKQSPKSQSAQVFLNTLLNNSIYSKRKVIGDTASLKHFKIEELRAFYKKWYDPSLMGIAVAGDVDPELVEQKIVSKFSDITSKAPKPTLGNIPDYRKDSLIVYSDRWTKGTELNYIQLQDVFKNVNRVNKYETYLLRSVLNKLMSERIAKLSFKNTPYTKASISMGNFLQSKGALVATVGLKEGKVIEGINGFNALFQQIFQYGFTNMEIDKVKRNMLGAFKRTLQNNEPTSASSMINQMYQDFFFGNMIIALEDEYQLMEKSFAELDSIKVFKALKANRPKGAFRYLLTTNSNHLKQLPSYDTILSAAKKIKTQKTTAYTNTLFVPEKLLETPVKPGAVEKIVDIPEIDAQEILLSNGIRVIYKKSPLNDNKVLLAGFRKGGLYSVDSLNYINALYTPTVVAMSGYGNFSKEALSHFLAGNSAKVRFLVDKTRSGFFGSSNTEDVKTLFELFYLKATAPKVDHSVFKRLKKAAIDNISDQPKSGKEKFQETLKYLVRGKDYITKPQTKKGLELALQKQNIKPLYKTFFGLANNDVVTIIASRPLNEMLPYIERYIGSLPKGNFSNSYKYVPQPIIKNNIDLIEYRGESPKAIVSLVYQQDRPLRNIPELEVKNEILEAVLKLELKKRLREELGVVYGTTVSVSSAKYPKPLSRQTITLVCKPSDVELINSEIRTIINGIIAGKINFGPELVKVKTNLINKHNVSKQKNSFWTKSIRDYYFNQYKNWGFVTNYQTMVEQITSKHIKKLAKKYFKNTPRIKAVLYPEKQ